jgi:hypothetical protein
MSFHHTKSHYRKLRLCLEFQALPRAFYRALGTSVLTALHPLPRVGPSAGRDPRHNHVFAESQPSARCAPSEKERAPSHLGCRPLCRRLRREAVGTDATCAEGPLLSSRQRRWPGFVQCVTETFTKSFQIFTTAYTCDKTTTRQIS